MALHRTYIRVVGLGLATSLLSALLLAACGGGGSSTGAAPHSYALGVISGFGSVIVNGVHYKDDTASVSDEDGQAHDKGDLKLGMVVEVQADEIGEANNEKSATAQSISFSSLIRGPVESVSVDSLVVLGQTVKVTATTVFDDSLIGGLAALTPGAVVRVFGTLETTTGAYTATRIEPAASAEFYRLRGAVSAYSPMAKTLTIGTALIDVSAVTVPSDLAVGSLVRVKLQTMQVNGAWVAVSVKPGLFHPQDNEHSEVEGIITDYTSATTFSVDGMPVDAGKASFPDGTVGIVKGAHVEVEGAVVNGVLVATKVHLKTEQEAEQAGFDVEGLITSLDMGNSTFVVRGLTVHYASSVSVIGGMVSDLKLGGRVEVRGVLAPDGVTLEASEIKIKH